MDAVLAGKTASFDEIASAEGLAERHVRRLVPLAFLSPKIIQAIADGTAPSGLTVSNLTQALPHAWTAQEHSASAGAGSPHKGGNVKTPMRLAGRAIMPSRTPRYDTMRGNERYDAVTSCTGRFSGGK